VQRCKRSEQQPAETDSTYKAILLKHMNDISDHLNDVNSRRVTIWKVTDLVTAVLLSTRQAYIPPLPATRVIRQFCDCSENMHSTVQCKRLYCM
jgi:hypothetical protein